ncbi:manganese ABC transporter ATP-binding protein [Advenella kashmirensis W13003]|uniref:Manganese ABC transporter ATP-binding protein n=1 Tax=Advenella kashmirensis W13003 TaxID=1424334 RepID=V8QPC1_9BURK|nr:metal ABC transporter ATP-binding protein [Advenella kashmirensis]ETF01487.1 manganese ABC transporter ATP-binding protein [Advenella kashmirensis W13003]
MMGPAIDLQQVALTLGQTRILYDIDLHVPAGSIHALIGPNGAGKSSLIKTLMGQMPHRGSLTLTWPDKPGVIGYVPQALEFDRTLPMTVDDFMGVMTQRRPAFFGLSSRNTGAIDDALTRVGMQHKRKRRMGALSGGERQRIMLAQALIPAPALLVLDEPMAALDEAGVAVFEDLLGYWRKQEATVLWVEHDLDAVRRLADRVTGLNHQVIFDGPPAEMLSAGQLLTLFSAHPRRREASGETGGAATLSRAAA